MFPVDVMYRRTPSAIATFASSDGLLMCTSRIKYLRAAPQLTQTRPDQPHAEPSQAKAAAAAAAANRVLLLLLPTRNPAAGCAIQSAGQPANTRTGNTIGDPPSAQPYTRPCVPLVPSTDTPIVLLSVELWHGSGAVL